MLLWVVSAREDQLAAIRSDPSAIGSVLHRRPDPDRDVVRWGRRCRLSSGWHVLDFLLRDGGRDPDPRRAFLLAGGERLGDGRAHRAADVRHIYLSLEDLDPVRVMSRFDRQRMRDAGIWFYRLSDVRPETGPDEAERRFDDLRDTVREAATRGHGLVVVPTRRRTEVLLSVHPATDAGIARYLADPDLLASHLAEEVHPADRLVAWYPLQVALSELGDTPAHTFLEDGGEIVDEALQLRLFDPREVAGLAALFSGLTPEVLVAALDDGAAHREGFDDNDRLELAAGYARLRAHVLAWAAERRGLVTLLVGD